MAKRSLLLANPIDLGNGLTQTHVEINYVYIYENEFRVFTVQGNTIAIPVDPVLQDFLINLEDMTQAAVDV